MRKTRNVLAAAAAIAGLAVSVEAADKLGLKKSDVALQSAGPLAFGPDGVLFIGDPKAAVVYAIDTGDTAGKKPFAEVRVDGLDKELNTVAGAGAKVVDLAVNPQNGTTYLSVSAEGKDPAIFRVGADGSLAALELKGIATSKAALPSPPEDKTITDGRGRQKNPRMESITDLAFVDGQVIVSGLQGKPSPSGVESFAFPFGPGGSATSLEIFHGAHGKVENSAPIRVFVPFNIDGKPHLLAGFTCTPLVKFPLDQLDDGKKVTGTTVAELGNRNQPIDMIAYEKDGQAYLLMANTARGVMKISTTDIADNPGIKEPVKSETAGQAYDKVEGLANVVQLDKLDDTRAVIVEKGPAEGSLILRTIELP